MDPQNKIKKLTEENRTSFQTKIGLGLNLLAGLIFSLNYTKIWKIEGGLFMLIFIFSVGYFCLLLFTKKLSLWNFTDKPYLQSNTYLLLNLFMVGCFSLNQSMKVFYESTKWLSICLSVSFVVNILVTFRDEFPHWTLRILFTLQAITSIIWLYFSLYLLPMMPISIPLLLVLGLSIHTFIPLFLFIQLVNDFRFNWSHFRVNIMVGIGLSMGVVLFSITRFAYEANKINHKLNQSLMKDDSVPVWVHVAQDFDRNYFSELILLNDWTYQKPQENLDFLPARSNFDENLIHDPLLMLANWLVTMPKIPQSEKLKILEANFNARHQTQKRLWSGQNLEISQVLTQARVYPQHRLAYTEKTLLIHNSNRNSWAQNEEALFTFYVPEGTAVSSLSLWINGKEEKGYLTTSKKAENAYQSIVGVEKRDPAIVKWQEGNRVFVRVFPCTTTEDRRVKIGFTSPLQFKDGWLKYNNIYFKGPKIAHAIEDIQVDFDKQVSGLKTDLIQEKFSEKSIKYAGNYRADWQLSFVAPKTETGVFKFNEKQYKISEYSVDYQYFNLKNIYLDIDKTWLRNDIKSIINQATNQRVYVWNGDWIEVSSDNLDWVFEELGSRQFGLIPMHQIEAPNESLVITKSNGNSPNIKDLGDCFFTKQLKKKLKPTEPIRTFTLNGLTDYFKTLKELRLINCQSGDFSKLSAILKTSTFPIWPENQSKILIQNANIVIEEVTEQQVASKAPDHVLRLFAYNQLLGKIGANYFKDSLKEEDFINIASTGNVVSPISSLIVLETAQDYKRFDIKKTSGLENATLKKSGAVPEPHEWALIVILLIFVSYTYLKNR